MSEPEPEIELAEVYQGELDGALFEALFDDLERFTQIVSVHLKSGPEAHADEAHITLEKARMLMLLGRAHGIRVRYEHEGIEWIDTLLRGKSSIRLVRTRVPIAPSQQKGAPPPPEQPQKKRLPIL